MNAFGILGAWTLGFRFIAKHWLAHAFILIVIGIAAPVGLEYALLGGAAETAGPATLGPDLAGTMLDERPLLLLVTALGYLLQTGSYFASWRLGLGKGSSFAGALLYGLVAGLLAVAVSVVAYLAAQYGSRPFMLPDTFFLAVLVFLLPLMLVAALFFLSQAVMIAASVLLLLVFAIIYGAAMGDIGFAATVVGGNGSITALLLLLSGVMFWLAARLSCATAWMADHKSLNLFAAVRESFRLTWEDEWAITRYLALIGTLLALVAIGVAIAMGARGAAVLGADTAMGFQPNMEIPRLIMSVPIAFLTVLVPAGIYRQLTGEDEISAEVFE